MRGRFKKPAKKKPRWVPKYHVGQIVRVKSADPRFPNTGKIKFVLDEQYFVAGFNWQFESNLAAVQ